MSYFGFQSNTVSVVRFQIEDTGTYNDQFIRPYTAVTSNSALNVLTDRILTNNDINFTGVNPSQLRDITHEFMQPQSIPESIAVIPNNWGQRRLRFFLHVYVESRVGGSKNYYFLGYTDYVGVANNNLDPNMNFYINTCIKTTVNQQFNNYGLPVKTEVVDECVHLLADNTWQSSFKNSPVRLMRPEDIFYHNSVIELVGNTTTSIYNGQSTQNREAKASLRQNNVASNYVANLLSANLTASNLYDDFTAPESAIMSEAITRVSSSSLELNPFMQILNKFRDSSSTVTNNFTYKELLRVDPNTDNICNYLQLNSKSLAALHQRGLTSDWHGSDLLTMIAVKIKNSLPSLMLSCMLLKVHFKATNLTMDGAMNVTPLNAEGFSTSVDRVMQVKNFVQRFNNEMVFDITNGGYVNIAVEIDADIQGETWINVSTDGYNFSNYCVPTFADAEMVPVKTRDPNVVNNVTSELTYIMNHVKENVSSQKRQYSQPIGVFNNNLV